MEDEPRPSKKDIEELPSHVIEDIERISNPGSLLASLLIGRYADMEITSATMAGLWDMEKQCWDPTVADKVKHVNQKLGSPLTSYERVGNVSTYCAKRWRLSPKCTVVPFLHSRSADLVNLDLDEGDCVLRLDTQDTLSSYLPFSQSPQPSHCVTLDPRYSQPLGLTSRSLEIGAEIRKKACKGDWIKFGDSLRETQPGCLSNEKNAPRIPRFRFTRNQTENDKQSNKELIGTDLEDWCFEDGKKVKAFSPRPTEMPDQMDWKTINMSLEEFKEYKTDQYSIRALVDTEFLAIRGQLHYSASKDTPTLRILVIGTDPICKSGSFLQQLSNAVNLPVYMLTKPISFGVDDADTRCILAALLGRLQILRQPALEELEKPGPLELSVPVDMRDNPMWVEAIKKEKDARREKAITTYTKMLKDDKNINRQHALVAEPQQSQVQRYNQLYEDYKVCYKTMGKSE
ncbi:hypothetical protein NQZ79_g7894 [Umbelopsis isabellina]|nr:hypothetical protein NQZ79_g7894 [Umbelopsis isabellina]